MRKRKADSQPASKQAGSKFEGSKKLSRKNANYIITYIVRHLGFSCFGNNSFFYYDDDDDDDDEDEAVDVDIVDKVDWRRAVVGKRFGIFPFYFGGIYTHRWLLTATKHIKIFLRNGVLIKEACYSLREVVVAVVVVVCA